VEKGGLTDALAASATRGQMSKFALGTFLIRCP
jgi:hypothetical protein